MHQIQQKIAESADFLREHARAAEDLGRLPDEVAQRLREIGIVRMLQPTEYGGEAADPVDFFEAVMAIGALCGASGWVSGVVGVHPWQLGQWDERLQDELWGQDADTWIASPYAPLGRARKVEGGYRFSGRWPFSSGTDHCDWIILGGLIVDDEGRVSEPEPYNFVLPRADYTIHHDSWDVIGLRGSGSKDVSVDDAFIPDYRVNKPANFNDGIQAAVSGRNAPLYQVPFGTIFPGAINAATLGLAQGALDTFVDHTRDRVSIKGGAAVGDTSQMVTLGEAAADVRASRIVFLDDWKRMYADAVAGRPITRAQRIEMRSSSVRAVRRAVDAVDRLFMNAGGGSLQASHPLQRFWRDMHAGMNHICSVAPPMHLAWSRDTFGLEVDPLGW